MIQSLKRHLVAFSGKTDLCQTVTAQSEARRGVREADGAALENCQ